MSRRAGSWFALCVVAVGVAALWSTAGRDAPRARRESVVQSVGPGCYAFRLVRGSLHVTPLHPCTDPEATGPGPFFRAKDIWGGPSCQEVDVERTGAVVYGACPSP